MQIRQVLKLAGRLVIFGCVLCVILSINNFAQKPAKAASKAKEVWYLSYEVTIKGSGSSMDYNGAGDEATWVVDRSYSGTVELGSASPLVNRNMSQSEMIASLHSGNIMSWRHAGTLTKEHDGMSAIDKRASKFLDGMDLPIKIRINDKIVTHSEAEFAGRSFQNLTNTTFWYGKNSATKTQNTMELVIDKTRSRYNVTIPLKIVIGDPWLLVTSSTLVERSKYGWGDKPQREVLPGRLEWIGFDTLKIPEIKDLLENGMIHHPEPLPFELKDGAHQYDSGDLEIKEPLLSPPDSYKGVTIRIFYLFKKMPAN